MEESPELKKLFTFLQGAIYGSIVMEVAVFCLYDFPNLPEGLIVLIQKVGTIPVYRNILYSKAVTLLLIITVAVGSRPRKDLYLHPLRHIVLPLTGGLLLLSASVLFLLWKTNTLLPLHIMQWLYSICSFCGAILTHIALDNVSKHIKSGLLRDRFNIENESFDQSRKRVFSRYSVNIPMRFYFNRRVQKGWLNIVNPFRATLLIGTPGSGKTFSVIIPFIKQHIAKGFSMLVYDFKYPDLARVAYHHYKLTARKSHLFHVLNLNCPELSRRVNPLKATYITSLAAASETAEALIEALRKSDKAHGADQFFNQSAINFLAAIIYFFSRYQEGKFSTLAHVLAFTNLSYETIFDTLYREPEIHSLLSPFKSAFDRRAFEQLEGQIGTLRIHLSRLATKETFWIFSGDDFPLDISHPDHPAFLVIANDPATQSINSACYSVVLNRLIRLMNRQGNLPSSIIIDEVPTVYIHRIETLIATARSNKVSILLGLQELPQLRQQYGRETADTICSVTGNVLSGSARHTDTLTWLEKLFGKVRQVRNGMTIDRTRTSISMNEYMDNLIPASKIANLKTGELVAQVAGEAEAFSGKHAIHMYHCKVDLNEKEIQREEKCYTDLPTYYDFGEKRDEVLRRHMSGIFAEVDVIVKNP
ncbi:MAG: type IV secretory system conjugative DNA transfer family protein [Cyclobacteriaceae bacterium]|nr:type IV secretory system conjugative DNA transfer family protein [Cyclobacteriaceae bacterium]